MPELSVLHYRSGSSYFHRMDVRFKLLGLALLSMAGLQAGPVGLGALSVLVLAVLFITRLPVWDLARELRYLAVLLAFVWAARALSMPGDAVLELAGLQFSRQGLYEGGLICWRLVMIACLGAGLVFVTRSSEIRWAVEWFLKPVPLIPSRRISVMIGLIIRFLPMILDQARATAEAQKARGMENRKNPVFRLIKFAVPLLRRTFENADRLAVAMDARCFNEERTEPELVSRPADWAALSVVLCICGVAIGF